MIIHNIKLEYKNVTDKGIENLPIFFYTHQDATKLPEAIKTALEETAGYWNKEEIVAAQIFAEMIKTGTLDVTGYGIAPYDMEANGETITINLEQQTINGIKFATFVNA